MHEHEILYFTDAVKLAKSDFLVDAIDNFKKLITEFPHSDLADDAMYNIALSYFNMDQFEKAVEELKLLIDKHPTGTITALDNTKEFGKTAAKAYYLMTNCYLGLGQEDKAKENLLKLEKYTDSYIEKGGKKITFHQLAKDAIGVYISMKSK